MTEQPTIGFIQNFFVPECQPPRFNCDDPDVKLVKHFINGMWPQGVTYRSFDIGMETLPNETFLGALAAGAIATVFAVGAVDGSRVQQFDITNGMMHDEVGIYYSADQDAVSFKRYVWRQMIHFYMMTRWRVFFPYLMSLVVFTVIRAVLMRTRKRQNMGRLYAFIFLLAIICKGLIFRTHRSYMAAQRIVPQEEKLPFYSIENLADQLLNDERFLVIRGGNFYPMRFVSESTDPAFRMLQTALGYSKPIVINPITAAICKQLANDPRMVLLSMRSNVEGVCDMACLRNAHPAAKAFPQVFASFFLKKGSKDFNRATYYTEATRLYHEYLTKQKEKSVRTGYCNMGSFHGVDMGFAIANFSILLCAYGAAFLLLVLEISTKLFLKTRIFSISSGTITRLVRKPTCSR